ncbi:uncharacterized protein LOC100279477 [Zea mays]|jgi:hypothetical protein|nr:uncharacterized protein LOC100279477 [Zea mays]
MQSDAPASDQAKTSAVPNDAAKWHSEAVVIGETRRALCVLYFVLHTGWA